jgi:hypothetical protein
MLCNIERNMTAFLSLRKNILANYTIYTSTYIMLLMRSCPLRGKWEGVGPWKLRLFGPCEMASSHLGEIFRGQPLPTCPHQKHYVQDYINQRSIGNFMYMTFCILYSVFCIRCFLLVDVVSFMYMSSGSTPSNGLTFFAYSRWKLNKFKHMLSIICRNQNNCSNFKLALSIC